MCCRNATSRPSCGCGCGCGCHCGCSCGCGGGATTLPSFPDCPAYERVEREFPVYISMPATMARGTANMTAAVERAAEPCGCGRG